MLKKILAGLGTIVLGAGMAVATSVVVATADPSTDPTTGQCIVDRTYVPAQEEISHTEYRYKKYIPGQEDTYTTEYKFQRTATIYTVEHKQVKYTGTNSAAIAWLNGHGTFEGGGVWTLDDETVNGAGVNPFAPGIYYDGPFSSDHTVSLSAYGGPSVSVQYRITGIDWGFTQPDTPFWTSHTVTLYYTGSGDGSPLAADAIWTPTAPGDPWQQYDTRQVSNNDGFPGYWVYYVKGGTPTTTLGEENWTDEDQEAVGPEWTFIDDRTVIDQEAKDAYWIDVYGDCEIDLFEVSCLANVDGDTLTLPYIEGVLWSVDGGTPQSGPVVVQLTTTDVHIEATAASGYVFKDGQQTSWTLEADDSGVCQIPTLVLYPTNLTYSQQVCDAGQLLPGTVTVGMVGGVPFFTGMVDYFLDGSLTPMSSQTVALAPGLHTVTAAPHDPDDSLDGDTYWEFTIDPTDELCTDIPTLPLTGGALSVPGVLGGLALLGTGLALTIVTARRSISEI